jgi:uncharacterized protein (TIGR03437 family)
MKTLLLVVLVAAEAVAQTPANWFEQFPQAAPSKLGSYAMAYDSAHSQSVLFGAGIIAYPFPSATWLWDGSNWTEQSPANSPSGRDGHTMAYDSFHHQVVLFGGFDGSSVLSDTWLWDGSNWTQAFPQNIPPGRSSAAMAYDSAHGEVVLFGGEPASDPLFAELNDTWVWDGSNWTQRFPNNSPLARWASAMVYDSMHGQIVIFGGFPNGPNYLNDTWVWDGSDWTQESPQNSPSARESYGFAYDSAHNQSVLFGGADHSGVLGDTWLWDGSNWTQAHPEYNPLSRGAQAMDYDVARNQVVMFGGRGNNGNFLGDTLTWFGGAPAPPPPPPPPPPPGPSISDVISASAFGAFSAVAPGGWIEIYGSNLAPNTQSWTGADFTGNDAPTILGGVSVSIAGQSAFVDYISPAQVDAQLPSNIATGGPLQLTLNNGTTTSAPFNVTVNTAEPGLLAPASFKIGGNQYVVAQFIDGAYVLPTGAIAGVNSRPAKPGDTIIIYGVGFGAVTPTIPAGQLVTVANQLSASFEIQFGNTPAQLPLPYFGLAPSEVGVYQFNVVVPAVADSDLVPLTFTLGGVAGAQTLFTAVQQ